MVGRRGSSGALSFPFFEVPSSSTVRAGGRVEGAEGSGTWYQGRGPGSAAVAAEPGGFGQRGVRAPTARGGKLQTGGTSGTVFHWTNSGGTVAGSWTTSKIKRVQFPVALFSQNPGEKADEPPRVLPKSGSSPGKWGTAIGFFICKWLNWAVNSVLDSTERCTRRTRWRVLRTAQQAAESPARRIQGSQTTDPNAAGGTSSHTGATLTREATRLAAVQPHQGLVLVESTVSNQIPNTCGGGGTKVGVQL